MTLDTQHPLWVYKPKEPSHWDDYASDVRVYNDRVEVTFGWKQPTEVVIPAEDITFVKRGLFNEQGIVAIYTRQGVTTEIMAKWDKPTRVEFVTVVKRIMGEEVD